MLFGIPKLFRTPHMFTPPIPDPHRDGERQKLTASRRGQDKQCRHRSAAVSRNQQSWGNVATCVAKFMVVAAKCAHLTNVWQHV